MPIIHATTPPDALAGLTDAELIATAKRAGEIRKQYEAALVDRRLALKELLSRKVNARVLAAALNVTYERIRQIVTAKSTVGSNA
jgi:hypothetical protein